MSKSARLTALILIGGLFLTGCSTEGEGTTIPSVPGGEVPVVPGEPTEPTEPTVPFNEADYGVGDRISAEHAALIGTEGTKRAYKFTDGTFMVVEIDKPLPAPVKEAVSAELTAVAEGPNSVTIMTKVNQASKATGTGKDVLVIWYAPKVATGPTTYKQAWSVYQEHIEYGSEAEAIAAAERIIAGKENPELWEWIIVEAFV